MTNNQLKQPQNSVKKPRYTSLSQQERVERLARAKQYTLKGFGIKDTAKLAGLPAYVVREELRELRASLRDAQKPFKLSRKPGEAGYDNFQHILQLEAEGFTPEAIAKKLGTQVTLVNSVLLTDGPMKYRVTRKPKH